MVEARGQGSQNGSRLSWAEIIVAYLHNVERKDLPAASCSIAYGGSALSRKLHRWLSRSVIAALLKNGSLKPCRNCEGNGNDV